jgi:large subunit ribosomal protein L4
MTVQVSVYNQSGKEVEKIELSDYVFGAPFNEAVVHQAMLRQQANARQGTASTKTRSEVAGSSRKLFKQKGTGNARAGSIKSGLRPGGGILFGPKPRDYRQAMPKKMRQLAIRCALSAKVRDNELVVVKELDFEQPKTKEMAGVLKALEASATALIVTENPEENVIKSARNITGVKTMQSRLLNVVDILSHKKILMTVAAVKNAEEMWGEAPTKGDSNGTV